MPSKLAAILRRLPSYEPSWGLIASLAVYLALVGLAMGQLGALLEAMRLPGSAGFSASDLNDFPPDFANVEQTRAVLEVWRGYAAATLEAGLAPETADAEDVLRLFGLVDSFLFVPLYVAVLGLFFVRARSEFARTKEPPRLVKRAMESRGLDAERTHETYRAVALIGIGLICVAALADWVENYCYVRLIDEAWKGFPGEASPYDISRPVYVLWWAALIKWVAAAASVLCALGLAWILLARWGAAGRRRSRAGFWRAARLVALPTIYVVLFGFALVQFEQLPDLVRRWLPHQLLVTSLLVAILTVAVWGVTRRLLIFGPWAPVRTRGEETQLKAMLLIGACALAGAQLLAHGFAAGNPYEPGWGLLVPAVALLVLALFGWPISDPRGPGDGAQADAQAEASNATPPPEPLLPRLLAAAIPVFFGFGLMHASFGFAAYTKSWSWEMVAVALAAMAGAAIGVIAFRRLPSRRTLAATAPLLGAGVLAALVFLIVEHDRPTGDVDPSITVVWAVLATTAGLTCYPILGHARPLETRLSRRLVAALGVVVALLYAAVVASPWSAGNLLSGIGVLAAFLLVLTLVTAFLTWVEGGIPVPKALLALGFRRFPLVLFLVVWFLAATYFDRDGAYHNARVMSAREAAVPVTLDEAFDCWLARQGLPTSSGGVASTCATERRPTQRRGPVPMLFVASTGGGIRSAYWTGLALDCALELDLEGLDEDLPCPERARTDGFARSDAIFAASGISGGSLGLASYAAYLAEKEDLGVATSWVPRLSVDALSPAGAWWLFVETPRVFLQFDSPTDRAATLERAWEREWPTGTLERGMFALRRTNAHMPLLLLNGTSVGDGCRFNVSVLDASVEVTDPREQPACRSNAPFDESQSLTTQPRAGEQERLAAQSVLPATRDLSDFLCSGPYDVSLSTAALLSARFPYVNPAGRIVSRCAGVDRPPVAHVVDGGYLDTSGASPIVELMSRLEPMIARWRRQDAPADTCVVPLMIQIDNGFEDTSPPRGGRRPAELLIPPKTVFDARIGRAAEARSAAALIFNEPSGDVTFDDQELADRYAHFVNQAHPGPAAPLGWAQSRYSEEELRGQLRQKKNLQAISEVRQWFAAAASGAISCTAPSGDSLP